MRWPLYFVSNKIKNSLHRVSLMPLDGCRRFGAIEFERHDNHEKTIQLYPGTVRVREAFVLRSIEVYPWFNDLVTALVSQHIKDWGPSRVPISFSTTPGRRCCTLGAWGCVRLDHKSHWDKGLSPTGQRSLLA